MTQRRNHPLRRWTTGLTALALLLSAYGAGGFRPQAEETSSLSVPDAESAAAGIPSYADYRQRQAPAPSGSFVLEAGAGYTAAGASPEKRSDFSGQPGDALLLPDEGSVTWSFTVEQEGYYTLEFLYYPVEGQGNTILRDILLDGALPFAESEEVAFERRWVNVDRESFDGSGNQIRPRQKEEPQWLTAAARASADTAAGPLEYYLSAGQHTLTLAAKREPMLLRRIAFRPADAVPSYEQVLAAYEAKGYRPASASSARVIEAEGESIKSDQSLYPLTDRTSPTVTPYSASKIVYNAVGGAQWKTVGQWIEWPVDIPEDGLYEIALHFKQNLKTDAMSVRELTIDGQLPFAQADSLTFAYDSGWQTATLSDDKGTPYQFYFTAGRHTIRLRAGLGAYRDILTQTDACSDELNRLYRQIVVVTGGEPDIYRDYQFDVLIPDTLKDMEAASARLKALETSIRSAGFSGNQGTDAIRRLYTQMDSMTADPAEIAQRLRMYRDNISSLATWRNSMTEQPLTIDRLFIGPAGMALPKGEAGFFGSLKHYFEQFFASFFNDYSAIGSLGTETDTVLTVWMTTGRDQAQILRQLINDRFTLQTGVGVSLQLVPADALLPALLADTGPDISLGMTQADPLNLALRHALTDLSAFGDYTEVAGRFLPEAIVPFQLAGGIYALPETQSFPMLFYRKDILAELGVATEDLNTWDSLLQKALPVLQKNALNIGAVLNINTYLTLFYQRGGTLYNDTETASGLDTPEAIESMELYTMLYNQYGLPYQFDFANRFRSGEMPVVITDYLSYNQLTVFAPEIKGLWGMLPVPGTVREDGTVSHAAPSTVTGAALMASAPDQKAGWEFLKWWTSAEIQSSYGRDLESVVGSAARYNTANQEALNSVQWDYGIKQQIKAQAAEALAVPEAPGGYFTSRQFDFAFRNIAFYGDNTRTALEEAAQAINKELSKKQKEFGLTVGT